MGDGWGEGAPSPARRPSNSFPRRPFSSCDVVTHGLLPVGNVSAKTRAAVSGREPIDRLLGNAGQPTKLAETPVVHLERPVVTGGQQQPLGSRATLVRPRLSQGWDDDFYPDRVAKESEPATVVLCDGFGIRCISWGRAGRTSKSATISTCLLPPPDEGCAGERSSVKNHLAARVYGLLILEWRSRTPWTGLTYWIGDYGVCVGKGTFFGFTRQRRFVLAASTT